MRLRTISGAVVINNQGVAVVMFDTPFIDGSYIIALSCADRGKTLGVVSYWRSQVASGFEIVTRRASSGKLESDVTVGWFCAYNL